MFTNYLIYLNTLPRDEKVEQILILLFFLAATIFVCSLLHFFRDK